ncbi:MAG TPA: reverse transcriptase family protein, partial [Jatrophihabitans sp.]|nr:reverse transcriptase family protein [Jatrophihabitans sp.]
MNAEEHVASGVATALLAGPWTREALHQRVSSALGSPRRLAWVGALVDEVLAAYVHPPADRPRELAGFVVTTAAWQRRWSRRPAPRVHRWEPRPTAMGRTPWPVLELPDLSALARLLDVDQGELAWFADVGGWTRRANEPLRHYRWRQVARRGGGHRWVAAPKPRLKEIQRRLLRHVLSPIALHPAAHGAVPGRSVRSAVQPHTGASVVLRVDLTAFYASIPAARVWGLLRTAGYPESVAHTLTGLMTTAAPVGLTSDPRLRVPHLPQGAPTSPHLANAIAYRLDRRLSGVAAAFGAGYTRYVDDLTFSGPALRSAASRFVAAVTEIVASEGFAVNERKTVVLGASGQQRVLGAVVNVHPAVPRAERDALRATLHNCV